jgi:hypothetical protein
MKTNNKHIKIRKLSNNTINIEKQIKTNKNQKKMKNNKNTSKH